VKTICESCFEGIFWNIVSHGAIKSGSSISLKLANAVKTNPKNIVKNLKKIGFDRDMVEWIGAHTGVELTNYIQDEFGKE
jgi:hypothetical protein